MLRARVELARMPGHTARGLKRRAWRLSERERKRVVRCAAGEEIVAGAIESMAERVVAKPGQMLPLLGLALYAFFLAPPGAMPGLLDVYVLGPIHELILSRLNAKDVLPLERLLGRGSFGDVFLATASGFPFGSPRRVNVVVKRVRYTDEGVRSRFLLGGTLARNASEAGRAEAYMCARMQRAGPFACASFLGRFQAPDPKAGGMVDHLVWRFESEWTLADFMTRKELGSCPANLVPYFAPNRKGSSRGDLEAVRSLFRSLLRSLNAIHRVGVVHRDVKPSNLLLTSTGQVKMIDLGAAADLRAGVNFNSTDTILDPLYCPPEQLILPESIPTVPRFFACLASPAIFAAYAPDRFDMFSAGLVLLQLTVPKLQDRQRLEKMREDLSRCNWDLDKWRRSLLPSTFQCDFTLLDADAGAGWDLAKKLVRQRKGLLDSRLSASQALRHRFFPLTPWLM